MAYKKIEKNKKLSVTISLEQYDKLVIDSIKAGFDNVDDYLQAEVVSKICGAKIGAPTIQRPTGSGRVVAPSNKQYERFD